MSDMQHNQWTGSPWAQRWFLVSAFVVVLVLVAGLVIAVVGDGGEDQPSAAAPSGSTSVPATSTIAPTQDDPGASVCGLPAGDDAVPVTAPAAQWELVGGVAVPGSSSVGPGDTVNGVRTCFTHTPTGALFAAVGFVAATSAPQLQEAAAQQLTAAGPGRANALQQLRQQTDQGSAASVVGFTVLSAAADTVVVDLALSAGRGDGTAGLVHVPLTLRWEAGDWKVVLPATGDLYPGLNALPDMTGYIPWKAG